MPPDDKPCAERTILIKKYNTAVTKYAQAVSAFSHAVGGEEVGIAPSESDYDRLFEITEETRRAANHARLAIEEHRRAHGC